MNFNSNFAKIYAHFYKQFIKLNRSSGEWEFMIVYPLVHIFSIGLLAFFTQSIGASPQAAVYMLVGAFAWNFYVICQKGITYGILPEIWSESTRQQFVTPATPLHFILGNGAYGLFTGIVSLILMHLVSLFVFDFNIFAAGPALFLGLIGLLIYGAAEGLVIISIMLLKGPEYMQLTWIITGIVMILSAVYYPLELLPLPVQFVSNLLPTTHAIQAIRAGILTNGGLESGLLSIAIGFVYLAIGAFIFSKAIDKSRENGTILRL